MKKIMLIISYVLVVFFSILPLCMFVFLNSFVIEYFWSPSKYTFGDWIYVILMSLGSLAIGIYLAYLQYQETKEF